MNHANAQIAVVRDLALSRQEGVLYAVLGYGRIAGLGETLTAVPFKFLDVRHNDGQWAVNLDLTTEKLKMAPTIRSSNYGELTDPQWIALVERVGPTRAQV
jgi:hypothetical protein